eukprot:gnl/MRDRNA2_/MRDRNA2_19300_c0_seq1.p1 gnl/MRDRNA2_/MRDRNA2_19300_c0~~gnl/MRDRNA2_/MRDRNA2_19300_c0_seq1.p1  ORF type:complete len:296 (+),score=59.17 gnl/MRDRNA2_/MRDRNA2_19300_c0_seq1:98-889(+)
MAKAVPVLLLLASTASANPQFALTKAPPSEPKSPLCSPCLQLGAQGINILLNAILNAGVIGGCGQLCGHLKSKGQQEACDLVCDVVGIKAFIKALNNTDLDPFYLCESIHACKAGPDDAHVDLMSVQLTPPSISDQDIQPGAEGVTVEGVLSFNVTKETGVGEFGVVILGPVEGADGPVGGSFLLPDGLKEGMQNVGVKINIQDTLPDPTKDPPSLPVIWNPGSYEFRFHLCQGECGSKHPHSIDFGRKASNFTISKSAEIIV